MNPQYDVNTIGRRKLELVVLHCLGVVMIQRSEIVLTKLLPNSDKRCNVIGNLRHVLTPGDIESLALCIPCSGTQDPHFHLAAIANISSKVGKLFRGEDLTEMDLADVPVSFDDPEVLQRQAASRSTPGAVSQPQNRDTGSAPEPQSKRQRLVNDGITPDILFQHKLVVRDIMSFLLHSRRDQHALNKLVTRWNQLDKDEAADGIRVAFKILVDMSLATLGRQEAGITMAKTEELHHHVSIEAVANMCGWNENQKQKALLVLRNRQKDIPMDLAMFNETVTACGEHLR